MALTPLKAPFNKSQFEDIKNYVGNIYVGQQTVNSQLCNIWVGRAWQMQIQSNAILTGVKYRFFIEYN